MAYDPRTWAPELDNRKAEAPDLPRQALEAWPAMAGKTEATSRGKALELDNKKSAGAHVGSKGVRQTGEAVLFAAQFRKVEVPVYLL